MFADILVERIKEKDNISVVGLDPKIEYLPQEIRQRYLSETDAILEYNLRIIEAIHNEVAILKPQLAFYEAYGVEGIRCYEKTVAYAKSKSMVIIADAKRGDIGTTGEAYARAFFTGKAQADALTLNPYMGFDSLEPYLSFVEKGKGIFMLVKTSNPCSGDIQDQLLANNKKVYEHVAEKVRQWGEKFKGSQGYSSIMAVVGATYPEELKSLRMAFPEMMFLVPGYGAQGGTSADIEGAIDSNGLGAIVNSSRGIIGAHLKSDKSFEEATLEAVRAMKKDLNAIR